MKFTHTTINSYGTTTREYTVNKDNKVTERIKFTHDEVEFDKWFKQMEKEYKEQQENKYY